MTVFEKIVDIIISHCTFSEEEEAILKHMKPSQESIAKLRMIANVSHALNCGVYSPFPIEDSFTGETYGDFKSFVDFLNSDLAVNRNLLNGTVKDFFYPTDLHLRFKGTVMCVNHVDLNSDENSLKATQKFESYSLTEITSNIARYLDEIYANTKDKNIPKEAYSSCVRLYEEAKHILKVVGFDIDFNISVEKHIVKPGKRSSGSETHLFK